MRYFFINKHFLRPSLRLPHSLPTPLSVFTAASPTTITSTTTSTTTITSSSTTITATTAAAAIASAIATTIAAAVAVWNLFFRDIHSCYILLNVYGTNEFLSWGFLQNYQIFFSLISPN